jgi:hypothetical protein
LVNLGEDETTLKVTRIKLSGLLPLSLDPLAISGRLMTSPDQRKRFMPITRTAIDLDCIAAEIKDRLSEVAAVMSVDFLLTQDALCVWVGTSDDESETYRTISRVDDYVSALFRSLTFDFHVLPLPEGRRMEDFVSATQPIFRRTAA